MVYLKIYSIYKWNKYLQILISSQNVLEQLVKASITTQGLVLFSKSLVRYTLELD